MPLKETCCCCFSVRMGTLLYLYYYLICCLCSTVYFSTYFKDPADEKFLSNHLIFFYWYIFISVIGGLIFFATIVSISVKTPSICLLNWATAVVILREISFFYCVYIFIFSGDDMEKLNEVSSADYRVEYRRSVKKRTYRMNRMYGMYQNFPPIIYVSIVLELFTSFYSVFVFDDYKTELKGNPIRDSSDQKNDPA